MKSQSSGGFSAREPAIPEGRPARPCAGCGASVEVPALAERSAARLAHQSGGLGVPSSNLGAPTNTAAPNL